MDARSRRAARNARCFAEEAVAVPCFERATQQNGALTKRGAKGKLVESETFATSLHDACTSSLCEPESTYGKLWHFSHAFVIRDSADNACDLAILVRHVRRKFGQGNRGTAGASHVKPFVNDLVELGVGSPRHELVELAEKTDVGIVGLCLADRLLHPTACFDVDAHGKRSRCARRR